MLDIELLKEKLALLEKEAGEANVAAVAMQAAADASAAAAQAQADAAAAYQKEADEQAAVVAEMIDLLQSA